MALDPRSIALQGLNDPDDERLVAMQGLWPPEDATPTLELPHLVGFCSNVGTMMGRR